MEQMYKALKLVPVEHIDLHETFEQKRLEKTKQSIEAEQIMRHPVLVTQTQSGRYMVIDGVHRFTSLKALGYRVVPVQDINETQYSISTWNHKVAIGQWWETLRQDNSLPWTTEIKNATPFITMCKGYDEQYLYVEDLGEQKLEAWAKVVASYSQTYDVERIAQSDNTCVSNQHILMKYQPLGFQEIETIVNRGETVPAGVTRFNISGRCLNLQVPLTILKEQSELNRNVKWNKFLEEKMDSVRCYSEKVYLVEQ
ncbi:bifunctional transcriptional regulator/O-phospho-L-serine synthase SbnI [Staphylococcus equorum]|uniref:bifunctional transcriptional regulator/O-phospho-L-serine synthase SbnI n=1 Tax=Staphylococcus equorum TaxID=246432 RepID=UPI002DBE6113|nr:bifunctional transcriptional regulator/O-phospho-L-serine synthase SbnI [Staphylococcus equorum]MEB7672426.1 bifunctional transcriptional regulator/O-phospho-L-serine synthase SbnI [Staphylococcus equorum]